MPSKDWDPLEATAFLYYYSRGMPSALVADFIFRKCGKTSEPRTEKDVLEQRETLPWDEGKAYLNLQIVNRLLAQDMPRINFTWENFLAKMEFDREERAGLKQKNLLGRIEGKKKTQDPLVNQMVVKDTPKSAFRSGTTVGLAASLPGPGQSLLAPSPIPSSGFGYIGITGDASGFGGGYGSTPYPSTLQGPGNFAGASTGYASADFGYPSSQQAFPGLGQSAYNNTGHMSPPRWQDEPEEYDTEQEVLDYQSKPPPTSQQPPPSTQALPKRSLQRLTEEQQDPTRKENQDNPNPPKRRLAPKVRSRSRSRSLSRVRRLVEKIELPELYHAWPREVVIEMAQQAARGDRWVEIDAHFKRQCYNFYVKWILPDTDRWGWVEIERVKHLKAMGKEGSRRLNRKGTGQQQKR